MSESATATTSPAYRPGQVVLNSEGCDRVIYEVMTHGTLWISTGTGPDAPGVCLTLTEIQALRRFLNRQLVRK